MTLVDIIAPRIFGGFKSWVEITDCSRDIPRGSSLYIGTTASIYQSHPGS